MVARPEPSGPAPELHPDRPYSGPHGGGRRGGCELGSGGRPLRRVPGPDQRARMAFGERPVPEQPANRTGAPPRRHGGRRPTDEEEAVAHLERHGDRGALPAHGAGLGRVWTADLVTDLLPCANGVARGVPTTPSRGRRPRP